MAYEQMKRDGQAIELANSTPESRGDSGRLVDYQTTDVIRHATADELAASRAAAERDGGRGVIEVNGRRCYVEE